MCQLLGGLRTLDPYPYVSPLLQNPGGATGIVAMYNQYELSFDPSRDVVMVVSTELTGVAGRMQAAQPGELTPGFPHLVSRTVTSELDLILSLIQTLSRLHYTTACYPFPNQHC